MKKGDVISRQINLSIGSIILRNCDSIGKAQTYISQTFYPTYKISPKVEIKDGNAVTTEEVSYKETATVSWIIDNEVAIKTMSDTYRIFNVEEEPEWKVEVEATPSYQSSVADMSDDQLKEAIERLREQRNTLRKSTKNIKPKASNAPLESLLNSLTPEQQEKLRAKLGL